MSITNRYALTRHVVALGVAWLVLLALLSGSLVALGAAQEDVSDVDRSTGVVVDDSTNLTVTNDTTDAYADLTVDDGYDDSTENLTATLYVVEHGTDTVLESESAEFASNSSGSIEVNVSDHNETAVDLEVMVADGNGEFVTVDDVGLLEEDGGGIALPGVDESVDVPVWLIGGLVIGAGALIATRD